MKKLRCYVCGGILEIDTATKEIVCMDCGVHYTMEEVRRMYASSQAQETMSMQELEHWKSVARKCVKKFEFNKAEWLLQEVLMVAPQDEEAKKMLEQVQDWENYHFSDGVLIGYSGQSKHLVIPDGVVKVRTVKIFHEGECNGFPKDIESVVFPDSVEEIGPYAFANCEYLTRIHWSKNLRIIGECAFYKCKRLHRIDLPSRVEEIDNFAFEQCENLQSVHFPATLKYIGASAFGVCRKLESAEIPEGIQEISANTFQSCFALKYVKLPNSLKVIGKEAFKNCQQLSGIEFPNGLVEIGEEAFAMCRQFKEIRIPASVKKLGANVFQDCCQLNHIEHHKSFPRYVIGTVCISNPGSFGYEYSDIEERDVLYDVFAGCPYGNRIWNKTDIEKYRYERGYCPRCGTFIYNGTKCEICGDTRFRWYWKMKILKWKQGKVRR